ncbi:13164_t:CDS:2 [Funneliformis geosporum]|uniref:5802_t:CDS:1 n=1 Tax=Funneliformis geosporum TaxID=1117311 RepID=A0A9W4SH78_9GLOM|nr:5802_t:CDS:2 [Funneliformis geosporum]CAI2183549.1 13164_t:CDS:2 [Funneliformis geosporum]
MKSTIIIAIIFGLVTSMTLTFIEANHTVWIQNKARIGVFTHAAATEENQQGHFNWNDGGFANEGEWTHTGYSLNIPDEINTYWLAFQIGLSLEDDKWRGPFNNDRDQCWHFHGTLENWEIFECSP